MCYMKDQTILLFTLKCVMANGQTLLEIILAESAMLSLCLQHFMKSALKIDNLNYLCQVYLQIQLG